VAVVEFARSSRNFGVNMVEGEEAASVAVEVPAPAEDSAPALEPVPAVLASSETVGHL
jgi:hypothetical protein